MPRAAGNERNYRIGVVNTNGQLVTELAGFPSVTTIIGATDASKTNVLMAWAYNVAMDGVAELLRQEKIGAGISVPTLKKRMKEAKFTPWSNRDSAAERGTSVHEWAEKLLRGTATYDDVLEGSDRAARGYARALIRWHESYVDRVPLAVEKTLVHLSKEYAGTVDLVDADAVSDGNIRVCDFKTSKAIYDGFFVQSSAYAQALIDMELRSGSEINVEEIGVIRFDKSGTFEEEFRPYEGARLFNAMREMYRELRGE